MGIQLSLHHPRCSQNSLQWLPLTSLLQHVTAEQGLAWRIWGEGISKEQVEGEAPARPAADKPKRTFLATQFSPLFSYQPCLCVGWGASGQEARDGESGQMH